MGEQEVCKCLFRLPVSFPAYLAVNVLLYDLFAVENLNEVFVEMGGG